MKLVCQIWMPRGTITDTKKVLRRYGINDIDITREFNTDDFRGKIVLFEAEEELYNRLIEECGFQKMWYSK